MQVIGKLLLLLFLVTGTISEQQNGVEPGNISPEVSRSFLNYNHPPLFALDATDPEEIEVRKVRDTTENSDNPITNNPLQSEKDRGSNIKSRTYVESSLPEKIPVAVIYDEQPTPRDNSKSNSTVVKLKRRKQPKNARPSNSENKPQVITEEKKVIPEITEVVTEKNPSTSPSPRTVVPKTFTKRPPEYNPVFKKSGQRDPAVKIIEETNFVFSHSGNFHYSFEGGDGTKVSSQGELKSFDNNKTGEAVVGSVFYKDDEGNDVNLSYTADENGYRPHGAHLPTPPPIPPAIARALEYLATATTPEPVTKPTRKD
ncbi:uncharacterized protein LOC123866633 [Maniola jurtina]|uniref:uncharacterized protein LOC123866633 n=1 Tax=Maniola jurtina TaxID=191418 RepID=UPI001E689DA9|nr:uncharacterized protein LOC123866633 [Maniola jurtina]